MHERYNIGSLQCFYTIFKIANLLINIIQLSTCMCRFSYMLTNHSIKSKQSEKRNPARYERHVYARI